MSALNPLLTLSATALAERIRAREVTSAEVVDAHIARIEAVNGVLNAVVAERFDRARDEARVADARTATAPAETLPPLHGVPCTIKESFALTGMPWTAGLCARRGLRAREDAVTVRRLRAAGAIPLGVTNTSELCMWMESNNRVYGRTRNPYDARRIVGGSSGGEGAIIGAGGSPFGLGADIGGSIRMPAFFNGVFGHKPTPGLAPNDGQFPLTDDSGLGLLATGPLARRAEDLPLLLEVLSTPVDEAPWVSPAAGGRAAPRVDGASARPPAGAGPYHRAPAALDRLRVITVKGDGLTPPSLPIRRAQRRAAEHLERAGATVTAASFPAMRHGFEIWAATIESEQSTSYAELLSAGGEFSAPRQVARWFVGRSPHTLPSLALAVLEPLFADSTARSQRMYALGRALRTELIEALRDDGVMLFPPHPWVAPHHNVPLLWPVAWVYTALFNALELPVTQVPLGLDRRGLPLGVQVVAAPGEDRLSIAVAMELERALGGWVPPSNGRR